MAENCIVLIKKLQICIKNYEVFFVQEISRILMYFISCIIIIYQTIGKGTRFRNIYQKL